MEKTKFVLVAKDWSPIIGKGETRFDTYEEAFERRKELVKEVEGGIILTSEKGLRFKDMQDRGWEWQITDREKGEISLLPLINA